MVVSQTAAPQSIAATPQINEIICTVTGLKRFRPTNSVGTIHNPTSSYSPLDVAECQPEYNGIAVFAEALLLVGFTDAGPTESVALPQSCHSFQSNS
jgi:hypothetical protein